MLLHKLKKHRHLEKIDKKKSFKIPLYNTKKRRINKVGKLFLFLKKDLKFQND